MKIGIMGSGGVGGYYGGLLLRAGHDVTLIARGDHLNALCENGLVIKSVFGDFVVAPVRATSDPSEAGVVDLVIVATKTYHTEEAASAAKPMIGPDTSVVSFQNGVDAVERIGSVIGKDHMLGGATWLSAAIEAPGIIGQYSRFRRVVIGELDGRISPRAEVVAEAFRSASVDVELVDNIGQVLWTKFVFISAVSALGSLTRVALGAFRQVPEARALLAQAISEVSAVAHAKGIPLEPDIAEKTLAFIDSAAPEIKPSMQRDIEAGRMSELESMIGVVVKLGRKLGVPTPFMRFAYAVLKPAYLCVRNPI